MLGTLLIKF